MKFINKKLCAIVLAGSFILIPTGCSNNDKSDIYNKVEDNIELASDDAINITEEDVINKFEVMADDFNNYIDSDEVQSYKYEINHILAEITGFLFYDDKSLGFSFSDLSYAGKQRICQIWLEMEILLEDRYPGFIANTSDKFNEAQNKGIELYNTGNDKINDLLYAKLGEENYAKVMETKEKIIGDVKGKTKSLKNEVYDWYLKYNEED